MTEDMGKKLREQRVKCNLTQRDVANAVGVTEATVSRWESGHIDNMRRDKIADLARVLRVSPLFIMGIDNEPSAPPAPQKSIEVSPAQKEDREHKHLQNLLSDPHLRRILESSGQLNESSLQEVQNFIDFQLGKKKQ